MDEPAKESKKNENEDVKILHSKLIQTSSPSKQKMQYILAIVLGCVLLYLIGTKLFHPKPGPSAAPQPVADSSAVMPEPMPEESPKEPVDQKSEDGEWGQSPFSLHDSKDGKKKELQLQGIVIDGKEAFAILNQNIVKVGDSLDDKKVKTITKGKVVLETKNGQELILEDQNL